MKTTFLVKVALILFLRGAFGAAAPALEIPLEGPRPEDPCQEVSGWREAICRFVKEHLKHSAWGFAHSKRDYLVAVDLAKNDGVAVNDDVLFAASMLHDMGGFAPYAIDGVDHALRSTQVVDTVLKPAGFPMEKAEAVKKAILTHSYYCLDHPETPEALVLHDADTLDFMGDIGVARIISLVGHEFPDLLSAFRLLKSFETSLPDKIYGGTYAKKKASERMAELIQFLKVVKAQSFELRSL